jgi:hypothetical protein
MLNTLSTIYLPHAVEFATKGMNTAEYSIGIDENVSGTLTGV